MNIGFIGAGNMGCAIIDRLLSDNFEGNIYVSRKNKDALKKMTGVIACENNSQAVQDITFLAVKPNMFKSVIDEIKATVKKNNSLVVSMAAGLTTDSIKNMFGFDCKIVRIMPNVNAAVASSTTAICKNEFVIDEEYTIVKELMSKTGQVIDVPENQFSVFSAIAGCSPAYVYTFIDALARGAQKMGMNKKLAIDIAASAVLGSAKYLSLSDEHPQSLVDRVCSPGGTTIEGLCTLEEYKFTAGIVKAVENIVNKDKELN